MQAKSHKDIALKKIQHLQYSAILIIALLMMAGPETGPSLQFQRQMAIVEWIALRLCVMVK